MVDKEDVLNRWHRAEPASVTATALMCSTSYVYKIVRDARDRGDERAKPPTAEAREFYLADANKLRVAEQYAKGVGIDAISEKLDLKPHIVRAAVYLATQAGEPTGLVLGG